MSRTTPHSFYDLFVLPNLQEYLEKPYDVRRGFNASLSAFQLADIMYAFYTLNDSSQLDPWPNKKALLVDLRKRQPLFSTVQSIATAYKHLYARGAHYDIDTSGSIEQLAVPTEGVELYTEWSGDVLVVGKDKRRVSLKTALTAVVNQLWPSVLPPEKNY
jgi:hypothetical protein